jgi:hypothetical protein
MSSEHESAHVIKSHICVVLFDACAAPGEDPQAVWSRLKIFVNAYVSKNRRNFVAIVLYGTEGVQVVYPPTQYEDRKHRQQQRQQRRAAAAAFTGTAGAGAGAAAEPLHHVPWASLSWPVRLRELNAQMDLFPKEFPVASRRGGGDGDADDVDDSAALAGAGMGTITAAMSVSLSLVNKFLNDQKAQGIRSSARMLLVHRHSPCVSRVVQRDYHAVVSCTTKCPAPRPVAFPPPLTHSLARSGDNNAVVIAVGCGCAHGADCGLWIGGSQLPRAGIPRHDELHLLRREAAHPDRCVRAALRRRPRRRRRRRQRRPAGNADASRFHHPRPVSRRGCARSHCDA